MTNQNSRTELLIGKENIDILKGSKVAVFGLGGVGSYVVEALARSGIGALVLIDHDEVEVPTDEDTDLEEITADSKFHDFDEWDSLIALAVLNMTEKKYGKKITFDEMKKCVTVTDLFNLIDKK